MNNSKMDYGKKYHYIIKYFFMAIPLLLLLLCYLFPTKSITNTYAITSTEETETTIDFNQKINKSIFNDTTTFNYYFNSLENTLTYKFVDTNNVSQPIISSDKLSSYVGHQILFRYKSDVDFVSNFGSTFYIYWQSNNNYYGITFTQDYYLGVYNGGDIWIRTGGDQYLNQTIIIEFFDLTQMGLDDISYNDFVNLFPSNYYYVNSQEITLSTLVNNVGNNAEDPLQSNEIKQPNLKYIKPLNDIYKLNINGWYDYLLNGIHLNLDDDIAYYLYHIPLYILYLYMFDLLLDVFGALFRIAHRFIIKFGGDY